MSESRRVLFTGIILFFIFFVYYSFTSSLLPYRAGPDEKINIIATKFIYESNRLPVFPADEANTWFPPTGTTRATRPPLSYITSGVMAHISPWKGSGAVQQWRHGSSLLVSLAVLVVFAGLYLYFGSLSYAVCGAILTGFLPQLTFIASYNNDDSAAIFSGFMLVLSMIVIQKKGVGMASVFLFSAACGLVLCSKFTAWLLLPFAGLFLLWKARDQKKNWWRYALLGVPVTIVFGGWWVALNIYNYGISDPLQFNLSSELAEKYRRVTFPGHGGYSSAGLTFNDIIINNYKNFIGESAKSTIGHLDRLRLRLGYVQYFYFSMIFFVGWIYVFIKTSVFAMQKILKRNEEKPPLYSLGFEWLMVAMFAAQALMYVNFNLYHDIQIQGKYMLPAAFPVLILFMSALETARNSVYRDFSDNEQLTDFVNVKNQQFYLASLIILSTAFVHADAYRTYVIPFYHPPGFNLKTGEFRKIELDQDRLIKTISGISLEEKDNGSWQLASAGRDPKINLTNAFCQEIKGNSIIKFTIQSESAGAFTLYFDSGEGRGFNEDQKLRQLYESGENTLVFIAGEYGCDKIRIDPFDRAGSMLIRSVEMAPLNISVKK